MSTREELFDLNRENEELKLFLLNIQDLLAFGLKRSHPLQADAVTIHRDTAELIIDEIRGLLR